jgi:predicted RNase H-like HicB family nuclease
LQRDITVPFTIEQDENGTWCASAALTPDSFANGEGATREAAIEDLKEAIATLADVVGVPEQVTVTVEVDG